MATDLSRRLGWIDAATAARVPRLLERFGLPTRPPEVLDPREMHAVMGHDKKARDGRVRLVLLRALGRVEVTADVPPTLLDATLAAGAVLCRD
jgi:3-dehydroquinate synthase